MGEGRGWRKGWREGGETVVYSRYQREGRSTIEYRPGTVLMYDVSDND